VPDLQARTGADAIGNGRDGACSCLQIRHPAKGGVILVCLAIAGFGAKSGFETGLMR
jgi:hypothetical protein